MNVLNAKNPLQKKGKCQKLANEKERITYMKDNKKYDADKNEIFHGIFAANNLESQISSLKDISKKITIEEHDLDKILNGLDFLFDLYVTLPFQSPLRNPLLRILSSLSNNENNEIQIALINRLNEHIKTSIFYYKEILAISNLLLGLLENSIIKYFSYKSVRDEVMTFLETSLAVCYNYLQEDIPPTEKLIVINGIHNCIRCTITLLQKCTPNPSENFFLLSKTLLTEEQLPSDCRATCGMLYVLLYKCLHLHINWNEFIDESEKLGFINEVSIFSGLLNSLKSEELNIPIRWKSNNIPLLEVIFERCLEIEASDAVDSSLIIGVSRCIQLVSKSLINLPQLLTECFLKKILSYVWLHLDHYIDAVRHIASNTLSNIVSAGKIHEKHFICELIAEETAKMSDERRAKHVGLISIIGHIPVNDLLQKSPKLIETLMRVAANNSTFDHIASLFDNMMKQHLKENSDQDIWVQLWIQPLIQELSVKPSSGLEHVLVNAIKLCPEVIHYVVSFQSFDDESEESLDNIRVILICLRTSRKFGLLQFKETNDKWKGLLSYSKLKLCISHPNLEIRLASFSLLIESQKSSENFTKEELDLIKLVFECNVNNQCPADRQKTLALIKKFLSRLNESYQALQRLSNKNNNKQILEKMDSMRIEDDLLICYNEFKKWLINFSLENIFPGANFSRRGTSLNILMQCNEYGFWKSDIFNRENASVLLKCLLDPYEDNKLLAINLLSVMPLYEILFKDKDYVRLYFRSALDMAASIRPPDSISAAYFICLLTSFPCLVNYIADECLIDHDLINVVDQIPDAINYLCLSGTLNQLKIELDVARKSLLKAASSAPMYGQLCVMRYILKGLNYRSVISSLKWKNIINEIINTAFDCNEVVACVVNNSSPEGHLPMDFSYENNLSSQKKQSCEPPVTAQMVLLCSWRTVKEVSLLLGEIVEKLSLYEESVLLSDEEIVRIGDHLIKLLLETKHRGAFEQAYLGFCKVAESLWRCSRGNLHELPNKWLIDTLNLVSSDEKLSATRRSAGVPFIIQGLVCSELQIGSYKCLEKALKTLFNLLHCTESTVEARAHSLNILRALFRHSMLGEMVGPYVAQGLTVAINGFNSSTWAERNSSTLLLSALMVRIFGVPRSRTEKINWKNKLTGKVFFQRYPQLFAELLKHLNSASDVSLYPAIYPVLLILGRLYPSPSEGSDGNFQLSTYIPLVSKCASSSVFKTRTLAASAMVALIPPPLYNDHINKTFDCIANTSSENLIHGLLLQVIQLLRHSPNLPEEYLLERNVYIDRWISEIIKLISDDSHSYIVKQCCLKIIITGLSYCYQYISSKIINEIISISEKILFECQRSVQHKQIGFSEYLSHVSVTLFTISIFEINSIDNIYDILKKCLINDFYEVVYFTLDFISFILNNHSSYSPDLSYVDPILMCKNENKIKLRALLINDINLSKIFLNKLKESNHHEDIIVLLRAGEKLPLIYRALKDENISVIKFFTSICEERHEILGSFVFQWISSYFEMERADLTLNEEEFFSLCNYLKRYSSPESDVECRLAAAKFLNINFHFLLDHTSGINYLTIWNCFLQLVCDDESDVRDLMSNTLSNEIPSSELLKYSFEIFFKNKKINILLKAVGLISWIIGNFTSEEDSWEDSDRVFEKGDSNTFSEELLISKISAKFLNDLFEMDSSILTTLLPEEVIDWIKTECSLNVICKTLQDFINGYKNEVNTFCLEKNSIPPFRVMEIKKSILEQKLDLLQKSLNFN